MPLPVELSPELDLFDYSLPHTSDHADAVGGWARTARAFRSKNRHQMRRAKAEAVLADILPADIADGDCWHVMSSGDVDSLSYAAHLLARHRMDYVAFSTWCMALADVAALDEWLLTDRIGRLDGYVGEIFPGSYPNEHAALAETVRRCAGRVCVFRNHSKVFLMRSGDRAWVIESSANINTNPRTENTCITADIGLFQHHKRYFDAVRSFNRDFDDWEPAP